MKILVTGGTGYIGSHTCVELLNKGYEVVVFDNLYNSKIDVVDKIEKITGKKITFYKADMLDKESMRLIFEEHKLDAVIHFAGLKAVNPDVIAWIQILALDISYPVVQGEDNDYYLKHSFVGESVNAGCIFMDCGASADWSDRNTFVFGHNMRDESMFGAFKNLLKGTASCEENPYFYIYTEDKVYIYEIFSYYETKSTSDRFATFTSDASYDDYVQWATEHSLYASDADLSDRGNIVSLSTCYGSSGTKRRALIHGVLIETAAY